MYFLKYNSGILYVKLKDVSGKILYRMKIKMHAVT